MTHTSPAMIDAMGLIAGVIAVCFAIYLQLIMQSRCPAKYVFSFFAVGALLIMMHLSPLASVPGTVAAYARFVATATIIAAEVWGVIYVKNHTKLQTPLEALSSIIHDEDCPDDDVEACAR